MKIIFLNSWYAKVGEPYFDFIQNESLDTDIFCLSEINPDLFSKLQEMLPDFKGFYEKGMFDETMNCIYGQAVFIKSNLDAEKLAKIDTFENTPIDMGYAVAFKLKLAEKSLCLINVHGKPKPGNKLDIPERIKQSEIIIDFCKDKMGPKIIGGDFNLLPETKSIEHFEKSGFRNLIKDFDIKLTRNKLCWDQFPEEVEKYGKQYFADYCFTSPDVKVKSFEVPYLEISDHLPLILEFET